jgi:beta-mannosidase
VTGAKTNAAVPKTIPPTSLALGLWSCCAQPPAAITHPQELDDAQPAWFAAKVPGTVASALQASGQWDLSKPLDADAWDWWYRTVFEAPNLVAGQPCFLCFDGLATLTEVWLNGRCLLTTDNMFRGYRLDITALLKTHNELVLRFRSLAGDLSKKRPRPRWKTNLVQHQQLRWRRTSLLGRIPGWSPPVPPVGPWRAVRLETGRVCVSALCLSSELDGATGMVKLQARAHSATEIKSARFHAGDRKVVAQAQRQSDGWELCAELRLPNAPLWWPHTHGGQPLLESFLTIEAFDAEQIFFCGKVGFRRLEAFQDERVAVEVNGAPVYCRGACWTVADVVSLSGSRDTLAHDLRLARDAGINMLRIGGTMVYESDEFYDLCDELGILVWQDFMFANMDYPAHDLDFSANVEAEATEQLRRLARHPSLAVYCGNSEVEQQAAMLGAPRELWRSSWFGERLPALCAEHHPGAAYVPSTPSGGVLPFHVASGVSHYYGIGAYRRSPRELRQADVKFTSECLGFANIPEPDTVHEITSGGTPVVHHPLWKQRVPRDVGAGWDFEDIRDHYFRHVFDVDPLQMRWSDTPRYLQLGRVVTGEIMAQTFAEWRSGHSKNRGGLIWFFKDLWPAAGWGIVDSLGRPKAAYYYLRRIWSNRQITLTDEGLDGLHLHAINETPEPFRGSVEVTLLKDQHIVVARKHTSLELPPRGQSTLSADAILGAFYDVTYAYRFGPANHDVVIATLFDREQQVRSEAFHFVLPREPAFLPDVKLETQVTGGDDGYRVNLRTNRFLHGVSLHADGFLPDDNYFHLPPARAKTIHFRPFRTKHAGFHGYLEALNLKTGVKFSAPDTAG